MLRRIGVMIREIEEGGSRGEEMRACQPIEAGFVERDGVKLAYEVFGAGEPTVVLLPTWSIVHSRHWKMQVPYLSRHCRVVTFDGRGNGRSDRPEGAENYTEVEFAADTLAVMDASATESAFLISLSCGVLWSTIIAADHPDRVLGLVAIAPAVGLAPQLPERVVHSFHDQLDTDEGWAKYNQHFWRRDYRAFLEFFFAQCLVEPHSTKPREDCVDWGLEMSPETLIAADQGLEICSLERFRDTCARVHCPVLVVHGDQDKIRAYGQGVAFAEATGGALVTLEGCGHFSHVRDPVKINLLLRDFVAPPKPRRWTRGRVRPEARAVYLLADRIGARTTRRVDRRRAAQAASRPRDRLACATPGDGSVGPARGADTSCQQVAGERVLPH